MNRLMLGLVVKRLGSVAATLLVVSVLVFAGASLLPGYVTEEVLGQAATPEAVAGLRAALNLDRPAPERYLSWLGGLVTGDLGLSLVNRVPVVQLIGPRLGNSLFLAALTAAVAVPFALLLGITSAIWRGSAYDRATGITAITLVSVPEFLLATIGVILFAVQLQWASALASVNWSSFDDALLALTLPVLTLSFAIMAQMTRMTRAALISVLDSSYIEMARLKGVRPVRLVLRHALPNAAGPIVNAIALSLSSLLGGVIIVETIFSYPGIAKLAVDAVATRDMPLVQACAMIFCAGYMLLVLIADISAILSNPRLRTR